MREGKGTEMPQDQTKEEVLSEVVTSFVAGRFPEAEGASQRAGAVAAGRYREGATVDEACAQAVAFVGSWMRHPSHLRAPTLLRSA
jgi:hypothetical protein